MELQDKTYFDRLKFLLKATKYEDTSLYLSSGCYTILLNHSAFWLFDLIEHIQKEDHIKDKKQFWNLTKGNEFIMISCEDIYKNPLVGLTTHFTDFPLDIQIVIVNQVCFLKEEYSSEIN